MRFGISCDFGFFDEDCFENLWCLCEIVKIFNDNGLICLMLFVVLKVDVCEKVW